MSAGRVWLCHACQVPVEPPAPVSTNSSAQEKIECFLSMFHGRDDLYAKRYYSVKTGKSGYTPVCKNEWAAGICDKKAHKCPECPNRAFQPLSTEVVKAHLMGRDPYCRDVAAIYPCRRTIRPGCWPGISMKPPGSGVWRRSGYLRGVSSYARCGAFPLRKTVHVWFFFSSPVPRQMRASWEAVF